MTLLKTANDTKVTETLPAGRFDDSDVLSKMVAPSKRKPSFIITGAVAILVAALASAMVYNSSSSTISISVLAHDVEAGEIIQADDLRIIETGSFSNARAIQVHQQELVIGQAARGPMPAGTVINTDLFTDRSSVIPAGMAVVGAELEAGAAPAGTFGPGDKVVLLGVQQRTAGDSTLPEAAVLAEGSVWAVEATENSRNGRIVVALLVPISEQGVVAQAAADNRLRLSLVSETS